MENLLLIWSLVAPVFIVVGIGYFLKRIKVIDDGFVKTSSSVVFKVSLPALIFIELAQVKLDEFIDFRIIVFVYAATLLSVSAAWLLGILIVKEPRDKTVFIQGAFRGNYAIIGLAVVASVMGPDKLAKAAFVLAFTIPLYNIISVIVLTVPLRGEKNLRVKDVLLEIVKNPLIIGVLLGVIFSYFRIPVHYTIKSAINYLAALSMPLALISIGGFMSFEDVKKKFFLTIIASVLKVVFIPLAATYAAYKAGFGADDMGVIFIVFGCPTAVASFIMAEAMGSNSKLAGNILLTTTLLSIITMTAGLFILKLYNLL